MFNAASVSSPDGGRNCFGGEKKVVRKKRTAQGGPLLDSLT
jgi:hypothetical protein